MTSEAAKSAKRALEVVELLSDTDEALSVTDVSRLLGYPASSTSVLLGELSRTGHLIHEAGTRRYRLAPRMTMAGIRMLGRRSFERHAVALVDSLHALTGEEIILAVQCGVAVQYVHLRRAALPFPSRHRPGALRPICRTSPGKILLAQKREDEVGRLVRRVNTMADMPPVLLSDFLTELREARESQFAAAYEEATPGAAGLAVSLPVPQGAPAMALAICGVPERIRQRREQLSQLLQRSREAAAGHAAAH